MKMPKNIARIQGVFIFAQFVILFVVACVFVFVISVNYVRKVTFSRLSNLNKTAELIVEQIKTKDQVPVSGLQGNYLLFIINAKDGSYVFERDKTVDVDQPLWESYHLKLIYEMQKRHSGWISYPDRGKWDLSKAARVIRFIGIDDLGWVVALEGVVESELSLLQELFNWSVCLKLGVVLFLGLCLVVFIADRSFIAMHTSISASMENHFMSVNHPWDAASDDERAGKDAAKEPSGMSIEHDLEEAIGHKPKAVEKSPFDVVGKKSITQKVPIEPRRNMESEVSYEESLPAEPVLKPKVLSREKKAVHAAAADSAMGDVALNIQGIKSPVLQKMIQKMRGGH